MTEQILKYSSIISGFVGLISAITAVYVNTQYRRFNDKKRRLALKYAMIFDNLNLLFSEEYSKKVGHNKIQLPEILKFFQAVTDKFKVAFDEITESNCRVTVRLFSYEENEVVIGTLTRDSFSQPNSRGFDKLHKQYLTYDTAASAIFSGRPYFLENDIPKMTGNSNYYNTKNATETSQWSFPYSSCLIVPITYVSESGEKTLLGLLSIDSNKRNIFDKSVDVEIARKLANEMSPYLNKVNDLLQPLS